jgi:IstB-like ATP binding protein
VVFLRLQSYHPRRAARRKSKLDAFKPTIQRWLERYPYSATQILPRYERGSIVLTTNKAFKQLPAIFNGDSTITSAVLDRLLHRAEIVLIEGTSYRMKERAETEKLPTTFPSCSLLFDNDFQTARSPRFSRRRSHRAMKRQLSSFIWRCETSLNSGKIRR